MQAQWALEDVNTDQQDHGLQSFVTIDPDKAAGLGLTNTAIDNTLYDAFGQRDVSTIYKDVNQYHVMMEVAPQYSQDPTVLENIYVSSGRGAPTPAGGGRRQRPVGDRHRRAGRQRHAAHHRDGQGQRRPRRRPAGQPDGADPGLRGRHRRLGRAGRRALPGQATSATAGLRPRRAARPAASTGVAVSSTTESLVPLSAFAQWADGSTPTTVNHQDTQPATTISFNLAEGKSLSDATAGIKTAADSIGMPATVHGAYAGNALAFQQLLGTLLLLIVAAIVAIYLVLGILYESYIHPLTVLSTLPSAGVGAMIALILFHIEFSLIAFIGIILLIGIVKKNAILMIDFALDAEREQGTGPARGDPQRRADPLPPDHDDHLRRHPRRRCRWRSAGARAPSCAGRSASPSSAACWSARCSPF